MTVKELIMRLDNWTCAEVDPTVLSAVAWWSWYDGASRAVGA